MVKKRDEPVAYEPIYTEEPASMFGAIHEAEIIVKTIAENYPGGVVKNEGSGAIVDFWYDKKIKFGDCIISISVAVGVYDNSEKGDLDE